jgi:hypothetical protein
MWAQTIAHYEDSARKIPSGISHVSELRAAALPAPTPLSPSSRLLKHD